MFEKLATRVVFGFRRNFLMGFCFKVVADALLSAQRSLREALGGSAFAQERALIRELPGYTVIRDKIFIPLATLKAAWRNQASNLFLIVLIASL
jgi:hypothetical protein